MTPRALFLAGAIALAAQNAAAQTYPSQGDTPVTDDAGILAPVEEARLSERVTRLEQDNAADIAIVTLPATGLYTMGEDLDVYAAGLARAWNLGDTTGGRSILLLVFRDDRELRLQITGDFEIETDTVATEIVEGTILPRFREDAFGTGISEGIDAVAARILTAEEAPSGADEAAAPQTGTGGSSVLIWIGGAIAALAGLGVVANRRAKARLAATPCASCGKTGLKKQRIVTREPTETTEGRGEARLTCPSCGHVEADPFVIGRKSPPKQKDRSDPPQSGGASGGW